MTVAIGMAATRRLARRGRRAAEEMLDDAEQRIRREPLRAVGLFFVAGVGVGALVGWLSVRRE